MYHILSLLAKKRKGNIFKEMAIFACLSLRNKWIVKHLKSHKEKKMNQSYLRWTQQKNSLSEKVSNAPTSTKMSSFLINRKLHYLHDALQAKEISEVVGSCVVFTTCQVLYHFPGQLWDASFQSTEPLDRYTSIHISCSSLFLIPRDNHLG